MPRIRIRGPGGTSTVTLSDDASVGDLLAEIRAKTSLNKFDVKLGYPPKPLPLGPDTAPLNSLGVSLNGEQLTISSKEDSPPTEGNSSGSSEETKSIGPIPLKRKTMADDVPEIPMPTRGSTLVLRVMPDDNSCLFRAFAAAYLPGDDLAVTELRSLVASAIQGDPEKYNQVVLEQKPDDYCRWIQNSDSWGGAIEMGILSNHFDVEICSIDVQSLRVHYMTPPTSNTRIILVYSGIHYDTLAQSPSDPPHTRSDTPSELDCRVFPSSDEEIIGYALELCRKLKEKHYFTDTGKMGIRCKVAGCGWMGHGQAQASAHAERSGHWDMEEVSDQ